MILRKLLKPLSGLVVVGVAVLAVPVLANPPFAGATYTLINTGNNSWAGMLKISGDGAMLVPYAPGAPSFVNADCISNSGSTLFTVHMTLDGLRINNPAGVIGSTFLGPERVSKNPSNFPGTLGSPRFFFRFFPSNSGPPTSGPPPQGPPTGGTASGPAPGDIGVGTVSGRNNPPKIGNQLNFAAFCSFSVNLFAFRSG